MGGKLVAVAVVVVADGDMADDIDDDEMLLLVLLARITNCCCGTKLICSRFACMHVDVYAQRTSYCVRTNFFCVLAIQQGLCIFGN